MAGQFQISRSEFMQLMESGDHGKLYDALSRGIQDYDHDSGWQATPTSKVFAHTLGVVPRHVIVQTSDSANGSNYVQETALGVTKSNITITGSKAFSRVIASR